MLQIDEGNMLLWNGWTDVSARLLFFRQILTAFSSVKGDCEELEDKFIELENVVVFNVDNVDDKKRRTKRKVKKFRLCKNVLGEGGMSLVRSVECE